MRHTDLDDSEVFNAFMKIAEEQGLLDKKAEYIYPDYDLSVQSNDLDFGITALAARESGLYGVTQGNGDDLVNDAHGKGPSVSDLMVKPEGDLSKVETIVEQHKKTREIALKMPTGKVAALATKLAALACELEDAGFIATADALDVGLRKLAREGYDNMELPMEQMNAMRFDESDNEKLRDTPKAQAPGIREYNIKMQNLINGWFAKAGKNRIPVSGKLDAEFKAALTQLGIQPGSYRSWQELQSKINQGGAALTTKATTPVVDADKFQSLPAGALDLPAAPADRTNSQLAQSGQPASGFGTAKTR